MHGERVGVCIWKGWSVRGWGEGEWVYGRGRVCMDEERKDTCIWKGGVCVHANSAPDHLTLSFLCRIVSGSQHYAYPNSRGHNINFARHQSTY